MEQGHQTPKERLSIVLELAATGKFRNWQEVLTACQTSLNLQEIDAGRVLENVAVRIVIDRACKAASPLHC